MALYLAVGIAVIHGVALLAAEPLFIGPFQSGFAGIVAAAVFGVRLNVVAVHLGYIAYQVSSGIDGIDAGRSGHGVESGKKERLLCKGIELFAADLLEERHGPEADFAGVGLVIGEFFPDKVPVNPEYLADGQGVEVLHVARSHHDVVGDFVLYDGVAVAVQDAAAGGINGDIFKGVILCRFPEILTENLYGKKPHGNHRKDYEHHKQYSVAPAHRLKRVRSTMVATARFTATFTR